MIPSNDNGLIESVDVPRQWVARLNKLTLSAPTDWALDADGNWRAAADYTGSSIMLLKMDTGGAGPTGRWAAAFDDTMTPAVHVLCTGDTRLVGFADPVLAQKAARALFETITQGAGHFTGLDVAIARLEMLP